jgi:hypothetical protein
MAAALSPVPVGQAIAQIRRGRLVFQVIDYSAAFAANASTIVMFEINCGGKP